MPYIKQFFVFVFFLLAQTSFAQDNSELKVITKNDGTEYIGKILSDDGREVLIETEALGKIYIPKADIRSITKVESASDIVYGEHRAEGPFTTRYAFTNNAHPIKKGENYAMVNLFGPEVHFAVTNRLNIGVMATWIASPLVLALKYNFKTKDSKLNFSAGTLLGTSGYLNQFKSYGGVHWLSMTVGDRMNNFTFSAGYAYIQSGRISNDPAPGIYYNTSPPPSQTTRPMSRGPIFGLGGICRVGAKASFVLDAMLYTYQKQVTNTTFETTSEGYYDSNMMWVPATTKTTVTRENVLTTVLAVMPGMRFQKNERKAFQISLAGISVYGRQNYSFPFPMCSWFYKI